ncbi:MAG: hypothetical protein HY347_04795 [candidate division NC10 bacterium]|nr:hypothetical protein [candidate division NC10 bacterium]
MIRKRTWPEGKTRLDRRTREVLQKYLGSLHRAISGEWDVTAIGPKGHMILIKAKAKDPDEADRLMEEAARISTKFLLKTGKHITLVAT